MIDLVSVQPSQPSIREERRLEDKDNHATTRVSWALLREREEEVLDINTEALSVWGAYAKR